MSDILICATRELNIGGSGYTFCDRIDLERHIKHGDIEARVAHYATDAHQIIPLTRRAYSTLIVQRAPGTVPKGFTAAELVALGITDPVPGRAPEPAVQPKVRAPKGPKAEPVYGELEPYKDYFLRSKKVGNWTHIDVLDKDQQLLRAAAFKKRDAAIAFLDGLKPAE